MTLLKVNVGPDAVPLVVEIVKGPVVPPAGATATIVVTVALLTVAVIPLNFTVLLVATASKLVPVIVTGVPTAPDTGLIEVIVGALTAE